MTSTYPTASSDRMFAQPPSIIEGYGPPIQRRANPEAPRSNRTSFLVLAYAFVAVIELTIQRAWMAIGSVVTFRLVPLAGAARRTSAHSAPVPASSTIQSRQLAPKRPPVSTGLVPPVCRSVWFNRTWLNDQLLRVVDQIFRKRLANGAYWYDQHSGEWGYEGRGRSGKIRPGLSLGGPLRADASRGTTGLFINGREITSWESMRLRWATSGPRSRYWVDHNGNFGVEGGLSMGNVRAMATQKVLLAGTRTAAQAAVGGARSGGDGAERRGHKPGLFSGNPVLSDDQGNIGWCGHDGSSASFGS